jgi:hypothetical protein
MGSDDLLESLMQRALVDEYMPIRQAGQRGSVPE